MPSCDQNQPRVAWWENAAGNASTWTERVVQAAYGGHQVSAGDLDGDGDPDVLAMGYWNDFVWWRNESIHRNATYPLATDVDASFADAEDWVESLRRQIS